jgi:hypothetical protein
MMDPNLVMVMPLCAPAASSDPLPLSKEETLLSIPGITMLSSVITLVIRQLILQTYPHDLPHDLIHRNLRNAWSQTIRTMVTASAMIVVVMTATDNGACITWIQMHRLHPAAKGRLVRPILGLIEPEILGPHLPGSLNPHSLTLVDHVITHLVRPEHLTVIVGSLPIIELSIRLPPTIRCNEMRDLSHICVTASPSPITKIAMNAYALLLPSPAALQDYNQPTTLTPFAYNSTPSSDHESAMSP